MILITICIPCYNTSQYIKRCLDSLDIGIKHNEKIELIIINDGSTDNSLDLIKEHSSIFPNKTIINKKNEGHGPAIEDAIKLATGKYFKILDSDDWFDKEKFIKFVDFIDNLDDEHDLILNNYSRAILNKIDELDSGFTYQNINAYFDTKNIENNTLTLPAITIKTNLLKNDNLEYPHNINMTDILFITQSFFLYNTITFFQETLYYYFIGRTEQSANPSRNKKQFYKNIHDIFIVYYNRINYIKHREDNDKKFNFTLNTIRFSTNKYMMETFFQKDKDLFLYEYKTICDFNLSVKNILGGGLLKPFWYRLSSIRKKAGFLYIFLWIFAKIYSFSRESIYKLLCIIGLK